MEEKISSAPEGQMHEVIEGHQGVEVVVGDFVVMGAEQTATQDHNRNLDALLQWCKEKNLKLDDKKMKLIMPHRPRSNLRWSLSPPCSSACVLLSILANSCLIYQI